MVLDIPYSCCKMESSEVVLFDLSLPLAEFSPIINGSTIRKDAQSPSLILKKKKESLHLLSFQEIFETAHQELVQVVSK